MGALGKQAKWVLYLVIAVVVGIGFAMVAPFIAQRKRGTFHCFRKVCSENSIRYMKKR